MKIELPDTLFEGLADAIADRVVRRIESRDDSSPWLNTEEAIEYTRLPAGTFRKQAADGTLPSHGGRSKVFHKAELDAALGYAAPPPPNLRSVHAA